MFLLVVIFVFVLINVNEATLEKILVGFTAFWLVAGFVLIGYALALV